MVRMSALRNRPVICGNTRLGLLQSVSLDDAQKQVHALIVSCGIRGKRVVMPDDVISVSDSFILTGSVHRYRRSEEKTLCAFVRDSQGLLVGCVTDCAMDERTLEVLAVEMKPGHLSARRMGRIWMYSYSRPDKSVPELIVPACMGSELIGVREERESCAYPP